MKLWSNIYFMRFRSGLRYWLLNSIVNRIPSWTIRRPIYQLFGMRIGKEARIGLYTTIDFPKGIRIGSRSVINEHCFLDGRGGLEIGDDVSISVYTRIVTASHQVNSDAFAYFREKVQIEDHVWTGIGAIILNGSVLSQGSVIGGGSVYKGIAEKDAVYVGNPAVKLKERKTEAHYQLDYHPWMR